MDLKTLRQMAGIPQARAAGLAGVSDRTWRRWELQGHTLAERWLRYEVGIMPGWPQGWRLGRDGLWTPGCDWVPSSVIEGARWTLQLVELRDRERVIAGIDASRPASPGRRRTGS